MRVRSAPGVTARITVDGRLELCAERPPATFTCGPVGAAMWIALHQHDGDPTVAAETLSAIWGSDPVNLCADFGLWIDELSDRGLLSAEA